MTLLVTNTWDTLLAERLAESEDRTAIATTAYDTAWLANVPSQHDQDKPWFPAALKWLVDNQLADGSWGSSVRYEHDRVLSTLAALVPLTRFGKSYREQECVRHGIHYLWQHSHLLRSEPMELVGFELLLPTMVRRAQDAGISVPPGLDIYGEKRDEKLRLIPKVALYSPHVTVAHSLEFLGKDADLAALQVALGPNGALGNSPAATAFYFVQSRDPRALAYLQKCMDLAGGATAPVLHPCETFELLWAAYHLFLAGIPISRILG